MAAAAHRSDLRAQPHEAQTRFRASGDYEAAVDEAITVCGGDARAAMRSLIVMTKFLEAEAEA